MATRGNLDYTAGETWKIGLYCNDASGAPLNLTGATVEFRMASSTALLLDLASNTTGIVVNADPLTGQALITVTPAMQTAAGIGEGVYSYQARAVLSDGTISEQSYGNLSARCSLWERFS